MTDETYDDSIYSTTTINCARLTWRELCERQEEEIRNLQAFATIIADLDRNEHGRHEGDVDGFTTSTGNSHIREGQTFGYSLHGRYEYRMPPREQRHDAAAWRHEVER